MARKRRVGRPRKVGGKHYSYRHHVTRARGNKIAKIVGGVIAGLATAGIGALGYHNRDLLIPFVQSVPDIVRHHTLPAVRSGISHLVGRIRGHRGEGRRRRR